MNYLYIIDSAYIPTAAATNRLFAFAHSLSERGCKCRFYYLFPDNNLSKSERYTDEFEFVYLWEDWTVRNKYLNTLRSIRKFYKQMKPEIPVYVYSMINCLYFIQKRNIRIFHEQTENPDVVGRIEGIVGKCFFWLYKKAVKRIEFLFVITPALKDKYIKELGVDPAKIDVVNMTVDKNRFMNLSDYEPSDTISYCGYISEFKDGVSVLIRAFAIVHAKHPNYKLQIIGPFADNETERNLYALVESLGVKNNVVFTGPIAADTMPIRLKSSKILALARPDNLQAKYGFATKIGEYLMTGRPAVLTRVGAVEDFLQDKHDCILADPDNVDDFAEKLLWTIDNYEEAASIGKRGRETALRCFNSEIEAEKIYNRIINAF